MRIVFYIVLAFLFGIIYFLINFILDAPTLCKINLLHDSIVNNIDDKGELLNSECYFSSDYYEAREKFRYLASKIPNVELSQLKLANNLQQDLTIDVAFIKGSNEKQLIIQSSATHGVEGFAGSAAQLAVLQDLILTKEKFAPSILFIHGVNPFGMKNRRRFNENNVDLNRNCFFDQKEFEKAINRDDDIAGYETFSKAFNPSIDEILVENLGMHQRIFNVLYKTFTISSDFLRIKMALVSGTYQKPDGIYYGGNKLEQSHELIKNYLKSKNLTTEIEKLALLDIHTGLGPIGLDSLLIVEEEHYKNALEVYTNNNLINTKYDLLLKKHPVYEILEFGGDKGAASGYDFTVGGMEGYIYLFPNVKAKNTIFLAQEFGTLPGVLVALSVCLENQSYHAKLKSKNVDDSFEKSFISYAFNPQKHSFQSSVPARGLLLFRQSLEFF